MKMDWVHALVIASMLGGPTASASNIDSPSMDSTREITPPPLVYDSNFDHFIESLPLGFLDEENALATDQCTPIDTDTLLLLGRGVKNRRNDSSIAVACETKSCSHLRFVYFEKSKPKPCFIGTAIPAPQSSDLKQLKKAYRMVVQEYLDYHPTTESAFRRSNWYGIFFVAIVVASASVALNGPASGPGTGMAALKTFSVMLSTFFLFTRKKFVNLVIGDDTIDASMSNASGWNWTERARSIRNNKFRILLNQIIHGNAVVRGQFVDHNTFELSRQYDRLREKLRKKGVEFPENPDYGR